MSDIDNNVVETPVNPTPISPEGDASKDGKAKTGMILGIIGLIAWIIPIIGLPVTIVGLVYSIKGMKSVKKALAITGIVLSSIGLVATIANASVGAYLGATGQHPLINDSSKEKKEIIKAAVEDVKKQMPTPYTVDEYTTLLDVTAESDAIRYYYSIAGISDEQASTLNSDSMKLSLVNGLCNQKDARYTLDSDINMEYSYNLKDYTRDVFVAVSKSDCK